MTPRKSATLTILLANVLPNCIEAFNAIPPTRLIHPLVDSRKLRSSRFASIVEAPLANEAPNARIADDDVRVGAWLPVASIASLAGLGPTRVELLNTKLVVWETGSSGPDAKDEEAGNVWSVLEDACAHRLAPLSQGRVDPATKCLECPYHGWQFGVGGACTKIPQLDTARGQTLESACSKGTGGVLSLPTRVTGDLLWAFFDQTDPRFTAHLGAEAMPIQALPDDRFPLLNGASGTYTRELPYSFDFLVENFMDPGHIPFAHHGMQGVRTDGGPIPMKVVVDNSSHVEVSYQDVVRGKPRNGVVSFARPCFYHFRTGKVPTPSADGDETTADSAAEGGKAGDQATAKTTPQLMEAPEDVSDFKTGLFMLTVPVKPGYSRLFILGRKLPKPFSLLPTFVMHALSSRFVDTDVWLHDAERYARKVPDLPTNPALAAAADAAADAAANDDNADVATAKPPPPAAPTAPLRMAASSAAAAAAPVKPRPYLSPTSSDLGVLAWRKWWSRSGMNSPGSLFGAALPHQLTWDSRQAQLDRVAYHASHCAPCAKALRHAKLIRRRAVPLALSIALIWYNTGGFGLGLGLATTAKSLAADESGGASRIVNSVATVAFLAVAGLVRWGAGAVVNLVGGATNTLDGEVPRRSEAAAA